MERTFELEYDGKRAYQLGGRKLICAESLKQTKNKAFQISLRVSNEEIANGSELLVKKVTGGWNWPDGGRRFPLIIYQGGAEFLDELFPQAFVEEKYRIWIKFVIKKQKKD